MSTFRQELETLINNNSMEQTSDTPDFILASFLTKCLEAFDGCVIERDRWHGWREGEPGQVFPLNKWKGEGGEFK